MIDIELTPEEKKAVNALKRLAKIWPKSLWLFSAAGDLCVMRNDKNMEAATTDTGGIDQEYIVEIIDIENSGGDW